MSDSPASTVAASPGGPSEPARRFVGAPARVDLMPAELHEAAATRVIGRVMLLLVVLALVVVGGGYSLAMLRATSAEADLATAQSQTAALRAHQLQFADVQALVARAQLGAAIERVTTGMRLDWQALVGRITAGMPGGTVLGAVTAEAASPIQSAAQSTDPLEHPRIGTIVISVSVANLNTLAGWLDHLQADPTFSDVVTQSIVKPDGGYRVAITLNLAPELTAAPAPTPTATPAPTAASASTPVPTSASTPVPTPTGSAR